MRTSSTLIAIVVSALTAQASLAQPVHATCESKRADISRDLEYAKAKGQVNRARGLEKALSENQAHCSDAKLEQEYAARITEQEKKVMKQQRDLDKARETGKAGKIAEREAKLAREKAELEKLQRGAR
jgi:multidrug resistance efflux pump